MDVLKAANKTTTNDSTTLSNVIWKAANDLWGDFKHTDFARIIIPLLLLRRLECVLEPTKADVLKAYAKEKDSGLDLDLILPHVSNLAFYNTSEYSLETNALYVFCAAALSTVKD